MDRAARDLLSRHTSNRACFAQREQDERRRTRARVARGESVEVISNVDEQRSAVRSITCLGVGGSTNHVEHELWVRQHGDVATLELTNRGTHAFRGKTL